MVLSEFSVAKAVSKSLMNELSVISRQSKKGSRPESASALDHGGDQ